jgi:hypothetical protein
MSALKTKFVEWSFICVIFAVLLTVAFGLSIVSLVIVNFLLENLGIFWMATGLSVMLALRIIYTIFASSK